VTIVPFTPNSNAPFQFNATLDGEVYTVVVPWVLWGQRYFIEVNDTSGNNIVTIARVGSPVDYDINLVAGYFEESSLVWRTQSSQFEITP
jgi:hypothetical protein